MPEERSDGGEPLQFTTDPESLLAQLWDRDFTEAQLEQGLLWVGRDHGPSVVLSLFYDDLLTRRLAARFVPDVWSGVEYPSRAASVEEWLELFSFAGYTYNGSRRARPTRPKVLYRGAAVGHEHGMSWTESITLARWFADRWAPALPGVVWQAEVAADRLLARITTQRPGEDEWVVATAGLRVTAHVG